MVGKRDRAMNCFLLLIVAFSGGTGITIWVSQKNGRDDPSCLMPNATRHCQTLQYALGAVSNLTSNDTNLRLEILENFYIMKHEVAIVPGIVESRKNTSITITSQRSKTTITCADGGILSISTAHNVLLSDLIFEECGPTLAAVVLVRNSRNITFHRCTFQNNLQAGINAFDSSVTVEECTFRNNTSNAWNISYDARFVPGAVSAGGGAAFVFRGHADNLSVVIVRSEFSDNKAVFINSEYFIDPSFNVSHFTTGGGGVLVVFSGSAKNCEVAIDNARFYNNSASYGGGIYVAADNVSKNNRFLLTNSELRWNRGGQAGGALGTTQWDNVTDTSVNIRNCTIEDNWSRRGGGMNVYFYNHVETAGNSELKFENVNFQRNWGNSSAALRFASSLPHGSPIPATAHIINCTFRSHVTQNMSYTAPLTSQKVSIVFKGRNLFEENVGVGAAEFENTILHVHGTLRFVNNTGNQGGALFLRSSQMKLYPDSEVYFADNHAKTIGGALSVSIHMMYEVVKMYNPDCFLVYSVANIPPSQWKTKISFIRNSAKLKGAAIFIASLFNCQWDELPPYHNLSRSLRWDRKKFVFSENWLGSADGDDKMADSNHNDDIATDTEAFVITSSHKNDAAFQLAPGEKVTIHIQGVDQLGHKVYTVASMTQADRSCPLLLNESMHVLSPANNNRGLPLRYKMPSKYVYRKLTERNSSYKIEVTDVYSTLRNKYSFELKTTSCAPGFTFDNESRECICEKTEGVLRCQAGRIIILKEGYWVGVSSEGKLISYYCPYKYCNCNQTECEVESTKWDEQCTHGRHGPLCGACPEKKSVGLRWYQCVESCDNWIVGVVVGAVVLLSALVIWLNPSISSELRGPLFFFQVLPFIFPPTSRPWKIVIFFANMFSFGGPIVYLKQACILTGITNLHMVAIGYVMPLVTMGVFFVSYVLSTNYLVRFRFRTKSSLHSFWLLILFGYHYLVETTFLLLDCPKVGDHYLFFYDGTTRCFTGSHVAMAALALVVLIVFIIPPPVIIILLTTGYWKVDPQYISTLTNGLRPQCLWWWAFELARRVLLVGTYVFVPHWTTKQVAVSVMCVLILTVHSNMQPYIKKRINVIESCYLLILSTMAILLVLDSVPDYIYAVLLAVPSLHTLVLTFYKAYWFFKKRFGRGQVSGEHAERTRYRSLEQSVENDEDRARRDLIDAVFGSTLTSEETSSIH